VIAWLVGSPIGRLVGKLGALIVFLVTFGAVQRRSVRKSADLKQLKDNAEKQEHGREAVNEIRDADRSDLVKRLHDNNERW